MTMKTGKYALEMLAIDRIEAHLRETYGRYVKRVERDDDVPRLVQLLEAGFDSLFNGYCGNGLASEFDEKGMVVLEALAREEETDWLKKSYAELFKLNVGGWLLVADSFYDREADEFQTRRHWLMRVIKIVLRVKEAMESAMEMNHGRQ